MRTLIVAIVLVALGATAYSQMVILSSTLGGPPPVICPSGATCIYFSQTGSDSTGDGSIGNPYQTVAKMETLFTGLTSQAGTHFLFNGGSGTWHEEIDIGTFGQKGLQGVAGNPVFISSYNGQALFDEQNQNPYCVNVQNPNQNVNYLTINNIGCTRAEHQAIAFEINSPANGLGITISNNNTYDTGPGCGHMANTACLGYEDEAVWATGTAYKSAASCNNSDPNSKSCGWVKNASSPTAPRFMELTASCTSGTSAPAWPSTRGATVTETTGSTPKCQWENMGVTTDYDNQVAFYDNNVDPHSVRMISNTVKWCGGHNCFELHGDSGQGVAQGNHVGPGCAHACLDSKNSGNYNAGGTTTSVLNPAITWPGNVTQIVNNVVQGGNALGLCGRNASSPFQANFGCDLYFGDNAGLPAGGSNADYLWQGNVGYDEGMSVSGAGAAGAALDMIPSGAGCSGGPCPLVARVYNNTFYSSPTCGTGCYGIYEQLGNNAGGFSAGVTQVDVRNNIIDGFQQLTLRTQSGLSGTAGGVTTQEDYNNFGGAQGTSLGITFNGSTTKHSHDWCASGCGTNTNINPTYVSASETSSADFRLLSGSPMLGVGLGNLTDATKNIGFYFGTGQ